MPLIGEHHGFSQGEGMDVADQSLFVGMGKHPQAHLPALTANCADNRWSVIVYRCRAHVVCSLVGVVDPQDRGEVPLFSPAF